jgi:glutamyl-tRNA reductase
VGSIAVDLARKVHGDLAKCTVLLLGAGKMAEAVAKTLASAGAEKVVVANRTVEKALKVAETYGWSGVALNDLPGLVAASDVVIASLGAPSYVLDKATMKAVLQRRRFRPVFLVDIAVPRVLDPEAGSLEGVYLYNIDDFNSIIEEHLKRRSQDVHQADVIVSREVEGVHRYLRQMELQPVIAELGRRAAETRDRELARAMKDLGELTDAQKRVLGVLANSLTTKMIHDPVTVLRETAADGSGAELADAVRRLWRLEAADKAGTAPGCGQAVLAGADRPAADAAGATGVPGRDEGAAGTAAGGEAT